MKNYKKFKDFYGVFNNSEDFCSSLKNFGWLKEDLIYTGRIMLAIEIYEGNKNKLTKDLLRKYKFDRKIFLKPVLKINT